MDNEYAKLARNLTVPEMGAGAGGVSLAEERRQRYVDIKANDGQIDDDDEYADGLC